jgi:hypothetical protein
MRKKSTGPTSEQGKEVVSHNAVKHGLLANNVTVLPGEETEYTYFAEAMRYEYGPDSTTEFLLVKKMIDAAWRQVRATKIEAGVLAAEMVAQQKQRQPGAEQESNGLERWLAEENPEAIELGNAYTRSEHLIATLSRCRVKLDREFYKALEELRIIQYGRIQGYHGFYVANLKKFPVPQDGKQERRIRF